MVTYKKAVPDKYLAYKDIVDTVICYGWIDSLPRKLDDTRTMLLFSKRKPTSAWSAVNKEKVARMTTAGMMHPAGIAAVETAKQNGAWDILNDVDAGVIPDDLCAALAAHPPAAAHFDSFSKSSGRGILEWITLAKRPQTRADRIAKTATLAAQNIKANH